MANDQEPEAASRERQRVELQDLLDTTLLDNGYIQQFTLDLFANEVHIVVRVPLSQDDVREHHVVFTSMRALFYQTELDYPQEDVVAGHDPAAGIPWPWAGYNFYDRAVTIRLIDPPSVLKRVGITTNFTLDVFNAVVLIAAGGVSIDDVHFEVGLPPRLTP